MSSFVAGILLSVCLTSTAISAMSVVPTVDADVTSEALVMPTEGPVVPTVDADVTSEAVVMSTEGPVHVTTEHPFPDGPCEGTPEYITSPTYIRYPQAGGYYSNDRTCVWKISAQPNHIIRLSLYSLDIEDCTECACDHLTVYNGDLRTKLQTICGLSPQADRLVVYSYFNHMDLIFTSDHSKFFQGFGALVEFVQVPTVAFFAVKISTTEATSEPVLLEFDDIRVNVNESFTYNQDKSKFICPVTGKYYFSLSAGANPRKPVGLILRKNGTPFVSLVRESIYHSNVDTLSRSVIMPLESGDVIDLVVDGYTSAYSDNGFQTSLTGFLLPFVPHVEDSGFFAGQVYNTTTTSLQYRKLEKTLTGENTWYNINSTRFLFPYTGVYMSSITAALDQPFILPAAEVGLYKDSTQNLVANIYRSSTTYSGFDTLSRDIMLSAEEHNEFFLASENTPVFSSPELQTSLSMYLVSTAQRLRPLFSGGKTTSTTTSGIVTGYTVVAQVGDGFNTSGTFRCTVPGIYFITFSGGAYYSASYGPSEMDLKLMLNSQIVAGLTRLAESHNGADTLSRSLLVDLKFGDQLYLYLESGSQMYSNVGMQTSFSGFLLYESPTLLKNEYIAGSLNGTIPVDH